jgi:hypothetical protein
MVLVFRLPATVATVAALFAAMGLVWLLGRIATFVFRHANFLSGIRGRLEQMVN